MHEVDRREFLRESIVGATVVGLFGSIFPQASLQQKSFTCEPVEIGENRWTVPVCRADVPNGNGRVYPRAVLEASIADLREPLDTKTLIGECGIVDTVMIRFLNASHRIDDLRFEGDYLMADIATLKTPMGSTLRQQLQTDPTKIVFRTRGIGTLRYEEMDGKGIGIVQPNFRLVTIDAIPADRATTL